MSSSYSPNKPIRWGILGAGRIAQRFAASLEKSQEGRLIAIAGRSAEKLDAFAQEHPVAAEKRYSSADDDGAAAYEALLADPDVDAVYLSLPHGMHAAWACRALKAGKAVLCEKPAATSEAEARQICDTAREEGALFMEAMKCRFAPLHERVRTLLLSGDLGAVTAVRSVQRLNYGEPPSAYLLDAGQGGALLDMGCYAISWVEELAFGPIEVSRAQVGWRDAAQADERVDWSDDVALRIGDVPVELVVDGSADEYEMRLDIECERGGITVERPHRPERAVAHRPNQEDEVMNEPFEVDDFFDETAHFMNCLRYGAAESPVMPLASTVRCANITDAIRAASSRA